MSDRAERRISRLSWQVTMFREQGIRTHRQNGMLAGYLAFVGGFVNSVGFVLIGTFTSHVTGNVGRAANDLATGRPVDGIIAASMVVAFFFGAFVASVIVESTVLGHASRAYGVALGIEAALLATFAVSSRSLGGDLRGVEALLLCVSMGMQNSLVTRLSGAVVRTTHLTGVITDLGIEAARWFRHWRSVAASKLNVPLVVGKQAVDRPLLPKTLLLLTIGGAFVSGAVVGSFLAIRWMRATMGLAAVAVALFAAYAALFGRGREDAMARSRK